MKNVVQLGSPEQFLFGYLIFSHQDGVVDPMDSTLRDFCGRCIEEFVKWSIKQTTPKQQEKSPTNMKSLFKRIYSLALHPNAFKRLGAALAFNSIYRLFRYNTSLSALTLLFHLCRRFLSYRKVCHYVPFNFLFFFAKKRGLLHHTATSTRKNGLILPNVVSAERKRLWWTSLSLKFWSYLLKVWVLHTRMNHLWVTVVLLLP